LGGGGALVGGRHFFQIDFVHTKQKSTGDEKTGQTTHEFILPPALAPRKSVLLVRTECVTALGSARSSARAQAGV